MELFHTIIDVSSTYLLVVIIYNGSVKHKIDSSMEDMMEVLYNLDKPKGFTHAAIGK